MRQIPNLPAAILQSLPDFVEERPALLVTSTPAWNAVGGMLKGLNIATRIEVNQATTRAWDGQLLTNPGPPFEMIYAVGGGLCADAGKYYAARLGLPLTVIPTALSVDAFLTAASGVRRDGCVVYIETKVPDTVILDLSVIASAPASIRAAGITDVLSIATGCWDWKYAEENGKNPPGMNFIPWVHHNARSIFAGVLDCAEAAGRGEHDGLKSLYDCLAMEVQLCNQIGHARPEEGSEHYFAYCAENFTGSGWPHGDLVGPGIMLMAKLQGQDTYRLDSAMRDCHIPLDRIPQEAVKRVLKELPVYCVRHNLPFGIAHTLKEVDS